MRYHYIIIIIIITRLNYCTLVVFKKVEDSSEKTCFCYYTRHIRYLSLWVFGVGFWPTYLTSGLPVN